MIAARRHLSKMVWVFMFVALLLPAALVIVPPMLRGGRYRDTEKWLAGQWRLDTTRLFQPARDESPPASEPERPGIGDAWERVAYGLAKAFIPLAANGGLTFVEEGDARVHLWAMGDSVQAEGPWKVNWRQGDRLTVLVYSQQRRAYERLEFRILDDDRIELLRPEDRHEGRRRKSDDDATRFIFRRAIVEESRTDGVEKDG